MQACVSICVCKPFVNFEIFYLHIVHEEILLVDVEHTQHPLRRHLNLTIGVKQKRHAVSAQTMPHLITLVFLGILDYSGAITRRREHTQRNGLRLHSSVPVLLSAQIPWQHDKPLSVFYHLLKSHDITTSLILFIFAHLLVHFFGFFSFFQLFLCLHRAGPCPCLHLAGELGSVASS